MNKKIVLPFITFLAMLVVNVTSIIKGVENHETWRIVVSSVALGLILVAGVVAAFYGRKKKAVE